MDGALFILLAHCRISRQLVAAVGRQPQGLRQCERICRSSLSARSARHCRCSFAAHYRVQRCGLAAGPAPTLACWGCRALRWAWEAWTAR